MDYEKLRNLKERLWALNDVLCDTKRAPQDIIQDASLRVFALLSTVRDELKLQDDVMVHLGAAYKLACKLVPHDSTRLTEHHGDHVAVEYQIIRGNRILGGHRITFTPDELTAALKQDEEHPNNRIGGDFNHKTTA